jgi:hypothetical protein
MACCVLAAALVGLVARRFRFGRDRQSTPDVARWGTGAFESSDYSRQ